MGSVIKLREKTTHKCQDVPKTNKIHNVPPKVMKAVNHCWGWWDTPTS